MFCKVDFWIKCFSFVLFMGLPCFAQSPADLKLAEECRQKLESLTGFYLKSVDPKNGGYLEDLSENGDFDGSEKFLTLQARHIWFFSHMAIAGVQTKETQAAAESGYQFLEEHFFDKENGGYFTKTTRAGESKDRRKHIYPNAFVIYAFVEHYRASGDERVLEKAMALFQVLEKRCYDQQSGGYHEFFYEDWKLITDERESGYVGAINTKTYNSHLHLLEAFTQLYRETKDPLVGKRLAELIDINTLAVRYPRGPFNIDGWQADWKLINTKENLRASYGHDVECAWLVLDAVEAIGRSPATYRNWAEAIVGYAIQFGYDHQHGGFFYSGPAGRPSDDRKKVWWTQTEAMIAMLRLGKLTDDPRYRKAFEGTVGFVWKHQIEQDGSWWNTLKQDGTPVENPSRTSMWQGAYHNGRALLRCEKWLRGE